jgi:N-methylhydantoinase B
VKGAINTTYTFVNSCVYACVRSLLDPSIPNNAGFMRAITVVVEPGSLLNSLPPAPVAARGLTAMRVADTMWGALAQMLPWKVFACGTAADPSVTIAGYHPGGRPFVHLEFLYGNWGGSSHRDGIDATSSLVSNYSNTPVEVLEGEHPIRIERYGFRPDSGGPGKHRGGLGILRDYRLLDVDEAVLQVRIDRQKFSPYGLYGGKRGAFALSVLNPGREDEQRIQGKFMTTLRRGQVFRAGLPGGGGWGDPLEREPEAVLGDVLNEKVSPEAARSNYGVVVDLERAAVDYPATDETRARMRAETSPNADKAGPS